MTAPGAGARRDRWRGDCHRYDAELYRQIGKTEIAAHKDEEADLYEMSATMRDEITAARAAYEAALAAQMDASETVAALRAAGVAEHVVVKVHRQTAPRLAQLAAWKQALAAYGESRKVWRQIGAISGKGGIQTLNDFSEPSDEELLGGAA